MDETVVNSVRTTFCAPGGLPGVVQVTCAFVLTEYDDATNGQFTPPTVTDMSLCTMALVPPKRPDPSTTTFTPANPIFEVTDVRENAWTSTKLAAAVEYTPFWKTQNALFPNVAQPVVGMVQLILAPFVATDPETTWQRHPLPCDPM